MPARPLASAIIIGHRSDERLAAAVRSVVEQDHRPLELVLFGNGAEIAVPSGLPADVRVSVGSAERNLGVAGGRNAAARLASGDVLLFVDDDAVLRPGALATALAALQDHENVGAVAFNVVDPQTGRPALWFHHPVGPSDSGRRFDTTTIIGCGNLVRRECFDALGGFWDGYFREVEEVDFAWRLVDRGWRIRYEPDAVVEHPERAEPHFAFSVASNLLLVWRLMPPPAAARQTAFLLAVFGARAVRHRRVADLLRGLGRAGRLAPRAFRDRAPLGPRTMILLRDVHAPLGLGKRLRWSLRQRRPTEAT